MNRTKIPWADWTWNPITGCSPASAGCDHCYAAAISRRFKLPWGEAHFHPERLDAPANFKTPGRVFVCSMGDIFHPTVQPGWRHEVFHAMHDAPWHTYIMPTKRPENMFRPSVNRPNWWFGVTCETQADADRRWPILCEVSSLRFVSVEPMLGPVTFRNWAVKPDWVIAGPETGPGARPCRDEWIAELAHESACFFDKRANWHRREWPVPQTGRPTP
jgi:protein gp37